MRPDVLRPKLLLSVGLMGCAGTPVPPVPSTSTSPDLIGYWELVAFENWDSAGRRTTPYGRHPRGYVRYTPDGRVAIQVVRVPPPPPFAAGTEHGTAAEKVVAFDAYIAYFGTYTVDSIRHTVVHHVVADVNPSYAGTAEPRPFRLAGDSLILGDERTWRRVFVRVR